MQTRSMTRRMRQQRAANAARSANQKRSEVVLLIEPYMSDRNLVRMSMTSKSMRNLIAPFLFQRATSWPSLTQKMFKWLRNKPATGRPPVNVGERRAIATLANMGVGHRSVMRPMSQLNNLSNFLSTLQRVPNREGRVFANPNSTRPVFYRLNNNGTLSTTSHVGRAPIRGVKSIRGGNRLALKM